MEPNAAVAAATILAEITDGPSVDPWKAKAYKEMEDYVAKATAGNAHEKVYVNQILVGDAIVNVAVRIPWDMSEPPQWGKAICDARDIPSKVIGRYVAVKKARRGKIPAHILPFI